MTQGNTARKVLRELVARNPQFSQRALLRDLRSQGYRISNTSGRALIRDSKRAIERAAEEIDGLIQRGVREIIEGSDFTYRERDIQNITTQRIENYLRDNLRNREVFLKERGSTARISDFTHAVIRYTANATISFFIEGRLYETSTETLPGQFTIEVSQFTEELIGERVRQQLEGIVTQRFAQVQGLGANSVVQGLTARVDQLRIRFTQINPRGSRARRG